MDIFATVCLAVTALTMVATSFWVAHIAMDLRKVRRAIESMTQAARNGETEAAERRSWSSADAA